MALNDEEFWQGIPQLRGKPKPERRTPNMEGFRERWEG